MEKNLLTNPFRSLHAASPRRFTRSSCKRHYACSQTKKQPWRSHSNAICGDWVAKHKRTTRNGVGNCSSKTGSRCQSEKKDDFEIPLGISTKEWDNPGCRKKRFFFAKKWLQSTWRTRTPHFLQRLPGSGFFREGILRGNRQADWIFCNVLKLLFCAGHCLHHRWIKQVATMTTTFMHFLTRTIL